MSSIRSLHQHIIENKLSIILFLFVGTLCAIVNLTSFSLLWHTLHINYTAAVSCAYFFSVLVHFTANRHLTFKDHSTTFFPQIQRYLIMLLTNYLLTLIIVHVVVETLHFSPYIGIISAIGCTVGINYFMSRFWVFQIL